MSYVTVWQLLPLFSLKNLIESLHFHHIRSISSCLLNFVFLFKRNYFNNQINAHFIFIYLYIVYYIELINPSGFDLLLNMEEGSIYFLKIIQSFNHYLWNNSYSPNCLKCHFIIYKFLQLSVISLVFFI